jgi:hypothetical protein
MARKQPAEDRDVLKFKLDVLHDHITHHERVLEQLQIDLTKAPLSILRRDADGYVDRVLDAVDKLYQPTPSLSALEQDLAEARAWFNGFYLTTPEWEETKSALIEIGFDAGAIESGFDSTLTHILETWNERMNRLRERVSSTEDWGGLEADLGKRVALIGMLLEFALAPAKHLRQHWLDLLSGRVSSAKQKAGRSKRGGRTKDPNVLKRNQAIFEAWQTGNFLTHAELAREFKCRPDVVRKAIKAMRRRFQANPITGTKVVK